MGDDELSRLADLLIIGAEATRRIADGRVLDRDELYAMALQAEQMAADLKRICERSDDAGRRAN